MGSITGKTWVDHSEPRIMAADLEAIEAALAATLAASTIVGAGRPDIPGTLAPDIATRVQNAPSGAVFRSIDGPQGAWEWMKRGTAWFVTQGDTGWRDVAADLIAPIILLNPAGVAQIRRVGSTVHVALRVMFGGDSGGSRSGRIQVLPLTSGFRAIHYAPLASGVTATYSASVFNATLSSEGDLGRLDMQVPAATGSWVAGDSLRGSGSFITRPEWPTTLPGTAA